MEQGAAFNVDRSLTFWIYTVFRTVIFYFSWTDADCVFYLCYFTLFLCINVSRDSGQFSDTGAVSVSGFISGWMIAKIPDYRTISKMSSLGLYDTRSESPVRYLICFLFLVHGQVHTHSCVCVCIHTPLFVIFAPCLSYSYYMPLNLSFLTVILHFFGGLWRSGSGKL